MNVLKEKIGKKFGEYCSKCNGKCCKKQEEATFFCWEIDNIKKAGFNINNVGKEEENDKIMRINLNGSCPFLNECVCSLGGDLKSLDCLSYPVFPIFDFKDNKKEIINWVVHKSCPFFKEIAEDKEVLEIIKRLWEENLKNPLINRDSLMAWFGEVFDQEQDKEYWHKKKLFCITNKKSQKNGL